MGKVARRFVRLSVASVVVGTGFWGCTAERDDVLVVEAVRVTDGELGSYGDEALTTGRTCTGDWGGWSAKIGQQQSAPLCTVPHPDGSSTHIGEAWRQNPTLNDRRALIAQISCGDGNCSGGTLQPRVYGEVECDNGGGTWGWNTTASGNVAVAADCPFGTKTVRTRCMVALEGVSGNPFLGCAAGCNEAYGYSTNLMCCGDGECGPGENVSNCYDDCGSCGDGLCTGPETEANCPQDCLPACELGIDQCGNGIPCECQPAGYGKCTEEFHCLAAFEEGACRCGGR
jgi:hypothetical protein